MKLVTLSEKKGAYINRRENMKEYLIKCSENMWVFDEISKVSDKYHHMVTDPTKIEDRCIRQIGHYLMADENNHKNRKHIKLIIHREFIERMNYSKREDSIKFSELSDCNDNDEETEFEPEDVLANVEDKVLAKEMTILLAQDDHQKKMILGYWLIGNTNNALISRSLARTFGGNEKSHRVSIYRFRESCRDQLATAI